MVLLDGPACRGVREPSELSILLQRLPPDLFAVPVAGPTRGATRCPRRPGFASYSPRRATPPSRLAAPVPQLAGRICPAADIAGAGSHGSEPGDRPLVVVTAAGTLAGWLPLEDRMATLSTNSSHRVVPYTHVALVTEYNAAQASSRAICDVVHSVRFTIPLKKS